MGDASDGGRQGIEHLATEGQGEGKGRVKGYLGGSVV